MSQGKRDTWGSNSYRGSLALFARYPQSSALEIPGGHEVVYDISFSEVFNQSFHFQSTGNHCQPNVSYLEPTGRGGCFTAGVVL